MRRWWFRNRERDLDDEIQAHVRMAFAERLARGEDPKTAWVEVHREFGNATLIRETTRSMWPFSRFNRYWADVRYALRGLRRSPGFTVLAVMSLGLGLGATTTAFSWIDSFLLRPLPGVRDQRQLVAVHATDSAGQEYNRISYPQYLEWSRSSRNLSGLVVASMNQMSMRTGGAAERVWVQLVSGNFFQVLGVPPAVGRLLQPADERSSALVAVISDGLWRRRFSGDSAVIGRTLTINGRALAIIGVAPRGFHGTVMGVGLDAWVPVTTTPVFYPGNASLTTAGWLWLSGIGRLRPGSTAARASADFAALGSVGEPGAAGRGGKATIRSLAREELGRLLHPLLLTLFGIAFAILIVACTNAANLLLVRGANRSREIGIRQAVGASRRRVIGQLLIETTVIAGLGGIVGAAMVIASRRVLGYLMPPLGVPLDLESRLDVRVLVVLFALVLGTVMAVGLLPAFRSVDDQITPRLRGHARGGRSRLRAALMAAQMAVSFVVLIAAGLFVRSLASVPRMNLGFSDPEQLLLISTDFGLAGLDEERSGVATRALLDRATAIRGVVGVTATTTVPMNLAGGLGDVIVRVPGYDPAPGERMAVGQAAVGPGYFGIIGNPLVRGRDFGPGDRKGAAEVVVVSESFARRFFGHGDPIGRSIETGGRSATIVGVAGDTKWNLANEPDQPFVFFALAQHPWSGITLVVRTARTGPDPWTIAEPIRRAFAAVNPDLPPVDIRTMKDNMGSAFFVQAIGAKALGLLGGVALLLAAVGLFGTLSYSLLQRTKEIGLRIALGSGRGRAVEAGLKPVVGSVAVGGVVGAGLALGVGHLISGQLVGVQPTDAATYLGTALLLVGISAAASLVPVQRAASVEPMDVLRTD